MVTATPCRIGSYQPKSGQTECLPCPAGYECLGTSEETECASGTFSLAGQATCRACFAGSFCRDPSLLPQLCPAGTFSVGAASECTDCKSGFYSVAVGASSCDPCPPAHSCANPASAPVECPQDEHAIDGKCVACPTGSFRGASEVSCRPCPAGYSCLGSGKTECPAGTYSREGEITCTACEVGLYSNSKSASCLECPANHYCPDGATAVKCPEGQESAAGKTISCKPCKTPSCSSTSDLVYGCPVGKVAVGAGICEDCPAGAQCAGSNAGGAGTGVQLCGEGRFSRKGESLCHPCPGGYSCTEAARDKKCVAGTYSPPYQSKCLACPRGHYCGDRTGAQVALPCPEGQYQDKEGQKDCEECPAGFKCEGGFATPCTNSTYSPLGVSACLLCPQGHACPHPFDSAVPCSPGDYSVDGAQECSPCPAGYECPLGVEFPIACALGMVSKEGDTECKPCLDGQSCGHGDAKAVNCKAVCFACACLLKIFDVCSLCRQIRFAV